MLTRNQSRQSCQENAPTLHPKRKAVESPTDKIQRKRSAFGDLTNALRNVQIGSVRKSNAPVATNRVVGQCANKMRNRSLGPVDENCRSADEDIFASDQRNVSSLPSSQQFLHEQDGNCCISATESDAGELLAEETSFDYDRENESDPFHVPHYAWDIFSYYKSRESKFAVGDYLGRQSGVTKHMRSILVDWMVEVQENFELNHETLYQAVKMTDLYLNKKSITKQTLQLVGTTTLFISAKFDERTPPASDDFLYICDDAYTRNELLDMEREILKELDFDIGFPLSYRFLRRFAKVSKTGMETLTLARYVLETSLMHYEFAHRSESLLAAGSLLLALKMKGDGDWTPVHRKYSGYSKEEAGRMMRDLNKMLRMQELAPSRNLCNIRTKYSHEVFYNVASVPLLSEAACRASE